MFVLPASNILDHEMIGNYGVVFLNCRGFEFHIKFGLYILSKINL